VVSAVMPADLAAAPVGLAATPVVSAGTAEVEDADPPGTFTAPALR
jgi:hypothetical protein